MAETKSQNLMLDLLPKSEKKLSVIENRGLCIICLKSDKIEKLVSPKEGC